MLDKTSVQIDPQKLFLENGFMNLHHRKISSPFSAALTALAFVLVSQAMIGCATSPTGRRQLTLVPDDQMNQMGVTAFDDMKKKLPISKDAKATAYVRCVAREVVSVLPEKQDWEIVVFENKEPNAFALPGGKIGVHTGMLAVAKDAYQLAAVLGHEVGHVLARHSNERVSEEQALGGAMAMASALFKDKTSKTYAVTMAALGVGSQFGIALPHSRTQESEADVMGLDLMSRAGFDPRASVELWKNMEKAGGGGQPEFMSTHPSHGTRIENLQANMGPALAKFQAQSRRPNCAL